MNLQALSRADLNTVSGLVVAFFLLIVGLVLVRITHHRETLAEQTKLFLVAYLARVAMILLIYKGGLISIVTDSDSIGWRLALDIHERWKMEGYGPLTAIYAVFHDLSEVSSNVGTGHVFYKLCYAALFLMTGLPGRITAAALNALFGALIPVLSYRMSMQIFGDLKAARYLGWTLALMPSLLVFSALTAKEPFVVFFEVLGLYSCVQLAQRRLKLRYLAAFLLSTYCMFYLRFYISNVLVGAMIAAIVVPPFVRGRYRKTAYMMAILASPLVMYVGFNAAIVERDEMSRSAADLQYGTLSGLRSYGNRMGGSSAVQNPFDITQPAEFVPGLLFGLVHLMYAPFPWNLARGSRLMLLTTPEVLWWYYVGTVRLVRGLRYGIRLNLADALIPILFCLPLLYYYSLIFSNIGLAYRYRAQIYPELILFIAFGYKRARAMHGYQGYGLPEPDEPEETFMPPRRLPPGERQPWIVRDRFDGMPIDHSPPWRDRGGRFRRM